MGDPAAADDRRPTLFLLLERLTAGVLLLVLALLGWMVVAAYEPTWAEWASTELQVVVILTLLLAALLLVSIVALWHTRGLG